MNLYLSFAFMILQIIAFPMYIHISNLQNDGRKGNQSEDAFDKQIKRWQRVVNTLQLAACICLLLNLLHTQGII